MLVAGVPNHALLDAQRVYAVEGYVRSAEEVLEIVRQGFREVFVDLRSALSDRSRDPSGSRWAGLPEEVEQELGRLSASRPHEAAHAFADPDGERLRLDLARARELYEDNLRLARRLFAEAAQGRTLSLAEARQGLERTLEELTADPAATLWAARLAENRARLHIHSVNVSLISMAFALHLGLDREDALRIGLAGLLHDLGQTRLPLELTTRRGRLSAAEQALFDRHAHDGEVILRRQGGVPEGIIRAVAEHHERHDGKGRPAGLSGAARCPQGRILALADQFDLLSRPGYDPRSDSPSRAMTLLFAERGAAHEPGDVERFVRFMGVYPLGSLVRLSDGRTAMVWRHDPENPLAPLVNVVLDAQARPMETACVNLALDRGRRGDAGLHIAAELRPEAVADPRALAPLPASEAV